jgi:hypothetical protein
MLTTPHAGITKDLLNKSPDTELNVIAITVEQFLKETVYNKGQAKMTNAGYSWGVHSPLGFCTFTQNL